MSFLLTLLIKYEIRHREISVRWRVKDESQDVSQSGPCLH